jgi:hypothetical protein
MFRFSRMPEGSQIFFLNYFLILGYFLLIRSFFVVSGFHLSGEVIPGRSTQTTVEQEVKFKVSVSFDRSAGRKRPSNNLGNKLSLPTNILAIMLSPRQFWLYSSFLCQQHYGHFKISLPGNILSDCFFMFLNLGIFV